MALQKPTIDTCLDGKEHLWMIVCEEAAPGGPADRLEHRWCKKCGCLTQVGYEGDVAVVATDEDGSPHLAAPRILRALVK